VVHHLLYELGALGGEGGAARVGAFSLTLLLCSQ
jgi:hypothetical protein